MSSHLLYCYGETTKEYVRYVRYKKWLIILAEKLKRLKLVTKKNNKQVLKKEV
jgi:hypothetical protein